MKATTKTITKTAIEITDKEFSNLNAVTWIFSEIYHKDDTTRNAIEKEWKNGGLNFGIEEIVFALNTVCNLTEIVDTEE